MPALPPPSEPRPPPHFPTPCRPWSFDNACRRYAGPADCAKQIFRESGIRGLYALLRPTHEPNCCIEDCLCRYKGTFATLLRDVRSCPLAPQLRLPSNCSCRFDQVPGSGAYFAGNEFAKRMMIPAGGTVADLGPAQLLLAGGTAGTLHGMF
jgi:solute carrier family 25 carnitine/acylcarnitine transporter 20/29